MVLLDVSRFVNHNLFFQQSIFYANDNCFISSLRRRLADGLWRSWYRFGLEVCGPFVEPVSVRSAHGDSWAFRIAVYGTLATLMAGLTGWGRLHICVSQSIILTLFEFYSLKKRLTNNISCLANIIKYINQSLLRQLMTYVVLMGLKLKDPTSEKNVLFVSKRKCVLYSKQWVQWVCLRVLN